MNSFINYVTEDQRAAGRRVAAASSKKWAARRTAWRGELRALRAELENHPSAEERPVILSEIERVRNLLLSTENM